MTGESSVKVAEGPRTVREKIDEPSGSIVSDGTIDWNCIHWKQVHDSVRNLRRRIYKATTTENWKQVRSLQKLMLRSQANLLLSIRRVTQVNRGKKTAGVDRRTALTPTERGQLAMQLSRMKTWEPLPTKRVYIPKSNGKQRPLGIPSLLDRCQQAMVLNALEPCWEAQFEEISYGFRPGRCAHDAIERIYLATKSGSNRAWILDADIKGCFDYIDHEALLERLNGFPVKELIRKWLKAGYMDKGAFFNTKAGTPQGGIISPLLANVALHGMEEALGIRYRGGASATTVRPECPVLVRYADDFVVICHTREAAEEAKTRISSFLAARGLKLSEEKTSIQHITDGFDFLGFNIRAYPVRDRKAGTKTLVKPSKKAVKAFKEKLRELFMSHVGKELGLLIKEANPVLRGWCQYYRHCVAGEVFSDIEHYVHLRLQRWCRRTHPHKVKKWWMRKYFGRHYNCPSFSYTFMDKGSGAYMLHPVSYKIERWIKVKHRHSPDDPELDRYWTWRKQKLGVINLKKSWQRVARNQRHFCPECGQSIYDGDELLIRHRDGNPKNRKYANLCLVHNGCRKKSSGLA